MHSKLGRTGSMKSSQDKPKTSLEALEAALRATDVLFEKTLKLHKDKKPEFDDVKLEAFNQANGLLAAIKRLLDETHPHLETRPLFRLMEEFRNTYSGASNVLIGHKNPNVSLGGKPSLSQSNEMNTLVIAMTEYCRAWGLKLKEAVTIVANDTGLQETQVRALRSRFNRGAGPAGAIRDLAERQSKLAALRAIEERSENNDSLGQYYQALLSMYLKLRI